MQGFFHPSNLALPGTHCENALALRLMAANRHWKRSALCVLCAASFSRWPKTSRAMVAETHQENSCFPLGEGMQVGKSETSLLPAASGFVPAMMPCV